VELVFPVRDHDAQPPPTCRGVAWCDECGCRLSRYRPAGRTTCLACGGPDVDGKLQRVTEHVLAVLEMGPLSVTELASAGGLHRTSVKDAIRRLRESGQVKLDPASTSATPRYRLAQ
jgi:hypothetical protein